MTERLRVGWSCFAFRRTSQTPTKSSSSTPSNRRMPTRTGKQSPGRYYSFAGGLEDLDVRVDVQAVLVDRVRLHRPGVLQPPHLHHLHRELDVAALLLAGLQADYAVGDVLHEAVPGGPRVVVLRLRGEQGRRPGGLDLLRDGEQAGPPLDLVREHHVQQRHRVHDDAVRAEVLD